MSCGSLLATAILRPVPVYVSMLRGINVSGRNRIAMADLRALYERHGHHDVTTYVQSGNVVSRSAARSARAVEQAIGRAIADDLGLDVTVLVRTPAQLAAVLDANPFAEAGADPQTRHVTFLATAPAKAKVGALDGDAFSPDVFRVHGREVFLWCPNGYGRTKINNSWFERKLGVAATTRNWKTTAQLRLLAEGLA
jgi:uncharacterized protein (DUF1697 family)